MSNIKPIKEYDASGNLIHYRHRNGFEYWNEYNTNGDQIHYWDSEGDEAWWEYDANGKLFHYREDTGYESWYDSEGNEYQIQEEAIRANTKIDMINLINGMSLDGFKQLQEFIRNNINNSGNKNGG